MFSFLSLYFSGRLKDHRTKEGSIFLRWSISSDKYRNLDDVNVKCGKREKQKASFLKSVVSDGGSTFSDLEL